MAYVIGRRGFALGIDSCASVASFCTANVLVEYDIIDAPDVQLANLCAKNRSSVAGATDGKAHIGCPME